MLYLTDNADIRDAIARLSAQKILWLDTEIADWQTPNPRLSLIQILTDASDLTGETAYLLDVLDRPRLVEMFVVNLMANEALQKVFHNASFDLRFLGKERARNVICTLEMSKKLSLKRLGTPNRKLKTLAAQLCNFPNVDEESGRSDWGQRPLSPQQLQYAAMDVVYLCRVHQRLLALNSSKTIPEPKKSDTFSATQLRIAMECPRLFYLERNFGGKTLFIPRVEGENSATARVKGSGTLLHKLAYNFIRFAKQDPEFPRLFDSLAVPLEKEQLAAALQQYFYEFCFYPYLIDKTRDRPERAPILLEIWNGFLQLMPYWAEWLIINSANSSTDILLHRTFLAEELALEYHFVLPNGERQAVTGQLDALLANLPQKRSCVVDYKTYEPADLSAQLAQVSLYSYLIWKQQKIPVDAAIYCVLPQFKSYQYSWEQLQATVHQLIPYKLEQMKAWSAWQPGELNPPPPTSQPHLCEICPQREKCQSLFLEQPEVVSVLPRKPEPSSIEKPANPQPEASAIEVDETARQLMAVLQAFRIEADYLGAVSGSAFTRVKLKPSLGVKVSSLLKLADDLQVQLGIPAAPMIAAQPGYVSIDLPREDRQSLRFEDYLQPQVRVTGVPSRIAIGVNLEGKLVEADLADANTCHFLVGGTTGSGKSEFLRSLLLSLLYRHSPQQLKIALVDPKRVTFPEFEGVPWLLVPTVKDSDRAIALMDDLVAEMERRYQRFEAAQSPHLEAYNQTHVPLPRIVCIFDEYADFMAEKDVRAALETSIKRIGAMARAAGIHLIVATQRPEAGVVTPIIRSNLPGRIALRTASEADSAIILGGKQSEAAYLLGKGDLLYSGGAQLQRLQSLYAERFQLPSAWVKPRTTQ